jgi:O-antigen/teichoic acid export membrane protein
MLRISFPVFSRSGDLAQLRRFRDNIVRMHATLLLPLLTTFVVLAPDLIPFLYGDTWEPVVRPAQILAFAGMAYAITTGAGSVLLAIGQAKKLLTWNTIELVAYTIMVAIVGGFGLIAVSVGVALFGLATIFAIHFYLLAPAIGMTLRDLWHDVRAGLAASILLLATGVPLRLLLDPSVPDLPRILIVGAWSAALAAAAYRWIFSDVYRDLAAVAPSRGRRPRPAA